MLCLLALILLRPKSEFDKEASKQDLWLSLLPKKRWALLATFFFIGVYIGLFQIGVGLIVLYALGHLIRLDLIRANCIKLFFVWSMNIVAVIVFILTDIKIAWVAGIACFLGQMTGAWIGGWIALEKGEGWIKVILTVSILLSSAKLLGLFDLIW